MCFQSENLGSTADYLGSEKIAWYEHPRHISQANFLSFVYYCKIKKVSPGGRFVQIAFVWTHILGRRGLIFRVNFACAKGVEYIHQT